MNHCVALGKTLSLSFITTLLMCNTGMLIMLAYLMGCWKALGKMHLKRLRALRVSNTFPDIVSKAAPLWALCIFLLHYTHACVCVCWMKLFPELEGWLLILYLATGQSANDNAKYIPFFCLQGMHDSIFLNAKATLSALLCPTNKTVNAVFLPVPCHPVNFVFSNKKHPSFGHLWNEKESNLQNNPKQFYTHQMPLTSVSFKKCNSVEDCRVRGHRLGLTYPFDNLSLSLSCSAKIFCTYSLHFKNKQSLATAVFENEL